VEVLLLVLECRLAFVEPLLLSSQLVAHGVHLAFELLAALEQLFLRSQLVGLAQVLAVFFGLPDDFVASLIGGAAPQALEEPPDGEAEAQTDQPAHNRFWEHSADSCCLPAQGACFPAPLRVVTQDPSRQSQVGNRSSSSRISAAKTGQ
jgi:hypothetical protein